jgi:hypothetical protein
MVSVGLGRLAREICAISEQRRAATVRAHKDISHNLQRIGNVPGRNKSKARGKVAAKGWRCAPGLYVAS